MSKKFAIIFVSLFVLLAIGVGVYLSLGKKPPVSHQASAKKLTEIKIANWKTYQNKDFSFIYPADWKISTQEGKIPNGTSRAETISSSSGVVSTIQTLEGGIITIQTITAASQSAQPLLSSTFVPATKLKLGKTEIQAYVLKQHGALINYLIIPYEAKATSYILFFDYYNYQHPDWDYPALFDRIIKSISFTNEK